MREEAWFAKVERAELPAPALVTALHEQIRKDLRAAGEQGAALIHLPGAMLDAI